MLRTIRTLAAGMALALATLLATASAGHAAYPGAPGLVTFVRGGNIFIANGATVYQVTTGGGYDWPRWSPGGDRTFGVLAYLRHGDVYWAQWDPGDGLNFIHRLTHGASAGAPSWAPDGTRLAWLDGDTTSGTLFIARFGPSRSALATTASVPTTVTAVTHFGRSTLAVRPDQLLPFSPLRNATAVAWSPDGNFIAFPGGECIGIFDACLSAVDLRTNTEIVVRAYGGDGTPWSGFATVPAWAADGQHLLWTEQQQDPPTGTLDPIHILSRPWPINNTAPTQVGRTGDVVPAPSAAADGSLLVTAPHNGKSWVTRIGPGGARTYLYQGYHEDWQSLSS